MFIELSAGRIRLVRSLFLLLGLLPCLVLAGWAGWRHSGVHREGFQRHWQETLGVPVAIGAVDHPRPGVLRLHRFQVLAGNGDVVADVPLVEVEQSGGEVRLRIDSLACTPEVALFLGTLARRWLEQPQRPSRACVIDVARLQFSPKETAAQWGGPAEGLRVECVAAEGQRAIRLIRPASPGEELRVRSLAEPSAGFPARRLEISGSLATPLPLDVLAAAADLPGVRATLGAAARVQGSITASSVGGRWSGSAAGTIDRIDLECCTAGVTLRASGEATLEFNRLSFADNRLVECQCEATAERGSVGQAAVRALVDGLGCRRGPVMPAAARADALPFELLQCTLTLDGRGMVVRTRGSGTPAPILLSEGAPLLYPPASMIPAERLAWVLSPVGLAAVPASAISAQLISLLPVSAVREAGAAGVLERSAVEGLRPSVPPR